MLLYERTHLREFKFVIQHNMVELPKILAVLGLGSELYRYTSI